MPGFHAGDDGLAVTTDSGVYNAHTHHSLSRSHIVVVMTEQYAERSVLDFTEILLSILLSVTANFVV